jgi:imidazole glycerol-phosphate synthase subunit HisF
VHGPRVIPCLLLDGEQLVKTRRFADPEYVGDPVNVLSIFNSFEVDEIVLLDIGAAGSGRPARPEDRARYAEECFIPLAYGGGLADLEAIEATFSIGYEKVVLNSVLADDPEVVSKTAEVFGTQAVVASIDVRGDAPASWSVHTHGGSRDTGVAPAAWARRAEDLGAGEILVTSVDREGTMDGYDLDLVAAVAEAVSVPVIAHGGAGRRQELPGPLARGASASAAGSLFVFQGAARGVLINYPSRSQLIRLLGLPTEAP